MTFVIYRYIVRILSLPSGFDEVAKASRVATSYVFELEVIEATLNASKEDEISRKEKRTIKQ